MKRIIRNYFNIFKPRIYETEFEVVQASDFYRLEGKSPSHLRIIKTVEAIGGGDWKGFAFKEDILKAAGWSGGANSAFSSNPDLAARALNKIRRALEVTSHPKTLRKLISK
ncbi:hypothetical protein A3752_13815 [Oleiphilus sp. HI0081]|nr:hypothetical protein A3743_10260 [Oleiphilus sp. HI0072]KZZ19651.1 hypothetical protein A3752_13815 [Oleiphilus sp. HI0081]